VQADSSSTEDLKGGAGPEFLRLAVDRECRSPSWGESWAADQEMEKAGAIGTRVSS
jgi:hypothetical protein